MLVSAVEDLRYEGLVFGCCYLDFLDGEVSECVREGEGDGRGCFIGE